MRSYDHVIIGFGKGGKTLAGALAASGQKVALIEKSGQMYGGTCINVACIPSKYLENQARISKQAGGSFEEKADRYQKAVQGKRALTAKLRAKNYHKVADVPGAEVLTGTASFEDQHHILVKYPDGTFETVEAGKIYINTGASPFIPPIPGLKESRFMYTSETMMELESLPKRLVIIGGGYIGVEFASYYANFGSQVTVIQNGADFLPREDQETAGHALESMTSRGIRILFQTDIEKVEDMEQEAALTISRDGQRSELRADAILAATGRRPNIEGLHPERAGVELTARGAIQVDDRLRTTAPNVWAMGDVTGGLQFTYMSLDDFRIVKSQVLGDGDRTAQNRGSIPYSIFIDPPFSRVGLTEKEAREQGYEVKTAKLPAAAIPKAMVLEKTDGFLKAVIDAKTGKILGAHLFCAESHEMINTVKVVMDAGLPYTVLKDGIFTHPTMSEAMNDLFAALT